ncbi:MAG: hypothetical protein Q8941_07545 [Bacteroidota bacterium]|nr:hypothetical protein [Bacteroidota bacterium]
MTDPDIIREKYASMHDGQLILLAREDSHDLTDEAMVMLNEEFARRNLDLNAFLPVEKEQTQEEAEQREPVAGFYNPATNTDDAIMGRNYQAIKNPAREAALAENEKKFMANLTEENLQLLIKKCDRSMLYNAIVFVIGFAVTLLTYLVVANKGGSYIVAWGAIVFGAVGFFRALGAKDKYESLLKGFHTKNDEFTDKNL